MNQIQFQPPYTVRPENKNTQDKEVSVWNWLVTLFILLIPLVNLVMLFVWGFREKTNVSKRNFCRAMLILSILSYSLVMSVICLFLINNMWFL